MDYENDLLTLGDGTVLPSANIYWVAGVKANSLEGLPADAYGPGNRLKVDTFNKVSGNDHFRGLSAWASPSGTAGHSAGKVVSTQSE